MIYHRLKLILAAATILAGCHSGSNSKRTEIPSSNFVTAAAETKPVPRDAASDAADDPAIWINFSKPDSSRIIGTDKQGGLAVYDLSGHELFYYPAGKMNNADLRYHFALSKDTIDLLAVSNRTDQSVDLYKINTNGSLEVIHQQPLKSRLKEEVYGLCMYLSAKTGKYYVFVNGKDGAIEQWELFQVADQISGRIVRNLKLDTQVEGMVADDEHGLLYVGEEKNGIWKFNAEPEGGDARELLTRSTEKENPYIAYDLEGMAIYKLQDGEGYLVTSSQGNDSYALFERKPPHQYLGSFSITDGIATDGTQDTDGLDLTSLPLGKDYPAGLLVVQDGKNKEAGVAAAQNFKLVRWDSISVKFNPVLNTSKP